MPDQHHIGLHTLSRNMPRPGSQSPPLPPPPEEHADFGRPRQQSLVAPIVPDDQNLPGWVPKNYIEKGEKGEKKSKWRVGPKSIKSEEDLKVRFGRAAHDQDMPKS
jgi:hypothetical protein